MRISLFLTLVLVSILVFTAFVSAQDLDVAYKFDDLVLHKNEQGNFAVRKGEMVQEPQASETPVSSSSPAPQPSQAPAPSPAPQASNSTNHHVSSANKNTMPFMFMTVTMGIIALFL